MHLRKKIQLIFLFLLPFSIVEAKQIVVVEAYEKESLAYFSAWWQNPAMRFYYPIEQMTDVSFSYSKREDEVGNVQEGLKENNFNFRANSFSKQQNHLYYGRATYDNGYTDNRKWSNAVDVPRLTPYIIGDTLGGRMYKEQYFFAGGFAKKIKKIELGGFASYRATTAFKKTDPRPKNTVSDLKTTIGFSSSISPKYALGWYINFNKYQQSQSISIYKEGGSAKLFFLRGFGVADKSFSTVLAKNSGGIGVKYKENAYSTGLSLYPKKQNGWFASATYSYTTMELLQGLHREITTFNNHTGQLSAGRKMSLVKIPFTIKLVADYGVKRGQEYNYNHSLELLNIAEKYKHSAYKVGIDLLIEKMWNSRIRNSIGFSTNIREDNLLYLGIGKSSLNNEKYQNLHFSIHKNTLWDFGKSSLLAKIKMTYRYNINKTLQATNLLAPTAFGTFVLPYHLYKTSDFVEGLVLLRYEYAISKQYRIYSQGNITYRQFEQIGKNQMLTFALGLNF